MASNRTIRRGILVPENTKIAVIVMSLNSDPNTRAAVKSVIAPNVETIVVNTGSGTLAHDLSDLLDHIVLIECQARKMPGGTRNLGIVNSSSPIVSFLAADCLAAPGSLSQRVQAHQLGNDLVSSSLRPSSNSLVAWACYSLIHNRRMPERRTRSGGMYGLSYSRKIFQEIGLFNEEMRVAEDSEFNEKCEAYKSLWANSIITYHCYPETIKSALHDVYRRARRAAISRKRSPVRQATSELITAIRISAQLALNSRFHTRSRKSAVLIPMLGVAAFFGAISSVNSNLQDHPKR